LFSEIKNIPIEFYPGPSEKIESVFDLNGGWENYIFYYVYNG